MELPTHPARGESAQSSALPPRSSLCHAVVAGVGLAATLACAPGLATASPTHLGCYRDAKMQLLGYEVAKGTYTPASCVAACAKRDFGYAALQYYGVHCLCGAKPPTGPKAAAKRCGGCHKTKIRHCGGYQHSDVYRTGATGRSRAQPKSPRPGSHAAARRQLLRGVRSLPSGGSPLQATGPKAFTVVEGYRRPKLLAPVVVAASFGRGRMVALGNEGYLLDARVRADVPRLLRNAVAWLSAGRSGKLRVGVLDQWVYRGIIRRGFDEAHRYLPIETKRLDAGGLELLDVLVLRPRDVKTPAARRAVRAFVQQGGGLLVAEISWAWKQRGRDFFTEHPWHRLLAGTGIRLVSGGLADTAYQPRPTAPSCIDAWRAMKQLKRHIAKQVTLSEATLAQCSYTLRSAVSALPNSSPIVKQLAALAGKLRLPIPSEKRPRPTPDAASRLLIELRHTLLKRNPLRGTYVHPAARVFPGLVPQKAKRVRVTRAIDLAVQGRHSLGLYAAPGERIRVDLPGDATARGLRVRVGAHSDRLFQRKQIKRYPIISSSWPLRRQQTTVANPFGGLVYIEVPRPGPKATLSTISVTIHGAVESPLFVLGQTTVAAWRQRIRKLPAPWAELATRKMILTLPSRVVRAIDDPRVVLRHWDRMMDACADLATLPRRRPRPYRMVSDAEPSAGYMHSGYPIVTHMDAASWLGDAKHMTTKGDWGSYHEIGHNHQRPSWTFRGTGEVTVNLFTLYALEQVNPRGAARRAKPSLYGAKRGARIATYFAGARSHAAWSRDPFLALLLYMQLQEAFGWGAYKRVFAAYRKLPKAQRPKTLQQKIDQFMVRFSKTVGKNLGPFFRTWGLPISASAQTQVAHLPGWMPAELRRYQRR